MVDDERLRQLRALGVKSVAFTETVDGTAISHVEFFPSIPALDPKTLVPPADWSHLDSELPPGVEPIPQGRDLSEFYATDRSKSAADSSKGAASDGAPIPAALARILQRKSVS